jgi:hypothetical protein
MLRVLKKPRSEKFTEGDKGEAKNRLKKQKLGYPKQFRMILLLLMGKKM